MLGARQASQERRSSAPSSESGWHRLESDRAGSPDLPESEPGSESSGGGSDAAFLAALAVCRDVHVYGVGLLGRPRPDGAIEIVYQHAYDEVLAPCLPHAVNASCGPAWPGDQYVTGQLLREVQWATWQALGLARWVHA